MKLIQYPSWKN